MGGNMNDGSGGSAFTTVRIRCSLVILLGLLGCLALAGGLPTMSVSHGALNEGSRVFMGIGFSLLLACLPLAFLSVKQNPRWYATLLMVPVVWVSGTMAPITVLIALSHAVDTRSRFRGDLGAFGIVFVIAFIIWAAYCSHVRDLAGRAEQPPLGPTGTPCQPER